MPSTGGKRVALVAAVVALVVSVTAGVVGRRWIVEEYYIWRLASDDEITRDSAALTLGEMKAVRAVPYLVRVLEREGRRHVARESKNAVLFEPVAYALYKIGPSALRDLHRLDRTSPRRLELGAIIQTLICPEIQVGVTWHPAR